MSESLCFVFMCNKPYFHKFTNTCEQLINNGRYKGDICLLIGDDLNNDDMLNCDFIKNNNIFVKYFPDVRFNDYFYEINSQIEAPGNRNITKKFQWHKLHLFNIFFKKWNYIFYLDCGMTIYSDVSPMIKEASKNVLLAHSDAFPTYEWRLSNQFDKNHELFKKLNDNFRLDVDYFQTTIIFYDTGIIQENTFDDLVNLSQEYPISKTNEQGIIALYFTNIKPLFRQIRTSNNDTHFYDYLPRNDTYCYIMIKGWSG